MKYRLTPKQTEFLTYLKSRGNGSYREMARELSTSVSNVHRYMSILTDLGYIEWHAKRNTWGIK